jgi:S1-C subfamily serine protease
MFLFKTQIRTVRPGTPASAAGLEANDFISRINGRIVFHLVSIS